MDGEQLAGSGTIVGSDIENRLTEKGGKYRETHTNTRAVTGPSGTSLEQGVDVLEHKKGKISNKRRREDEATKAPTTAKCPKKACSSWQRKTARLACRTEEEGTRCHREKKTNVS